MTTIYPEQTKQHNVHPPPGGPPVYTPYAAGSSAPVYPGYAQGQPPGYAYGQPHAVYTTGQAYGQSQVIVTTGHNYPARHVAVVQTGGPSRFGNQCPYCNMGYLRTEYTPLGLILALLFFPMGIICCMMMAERRCSSCHAKC